MRSITIKDTVFVVVMLVLASYFIGQATKTLMWTWYGKYVVWTWQPYDYVLFYLAGIIFLLSALAIFIEEKHAE